MFGQSDRLRDSVFPLVEVAPAPDGSIAFAALLGTGFLIGRRGWAITAKHVLDGSTEARALFVEEDGTWTALPVVETEPHPNEDAAAIRLPGNQWGSPFDLGATEVQASFEYCTWGYPKDVIHEVVQGGIAIPRPDLVFTAGHVRRRLRDARLPKVRGSLLAELTVAAGSGFSGAPILGRRKSPWSVVGIYLGERLTDEVQVGYALLTEVIAEWRPDLVGRPLRAEAAETGALRPS